MKTTLRTVFLALACAAVVGAAQGASKKIEVMAVYYPHWSVYPKGNEWFHPGWTEWEFARTAKPRFPGHKLPFKPLPGYLDGKDPTDVSTEIELASNAGIDVFLYDYYYYNGQITQQEALEEGFLKAPNRSKMKFALMWCYHERWNQFRPKYGQPRTKLMELAHTPEEFLGLIDYSIKNYFPRPEYWRKDGRLFFSIYNGQYFVKMLGPEKVKAALVEARKRVRAAGLGEIEFNTQNVGPAASAQMAELGFDSLTDYGFGPWNLPNYKSRYTSGELLYNFADAGPYLEKRWADYRQGPLPYYPIVPTGWDSTARCRPEEPFPWTGAKWNEYPYCGTFTNATPQIFEKYLRAAKAAVENDPKQPGVVYINAWNEYTEGCSLLPTVRECDQMLRCVGRVFGRKPADKFVYCDMKHWWNKDAKNGRAHTVDAPTFENVAYGPHLRQNMDVWLPKPGRTDGRRTPCVIMIHGGGWCDGDRMGGVAGNLPKCRVADCALVSISYRMVHDANDAGIKPPVKACLDDAVAAIKLVQAKAAEWNIDPTRIGLTGGSAGACSSLYASLQGDNALGIRAVLANSPQTSLDPQETKEWIPNARYGAHAFGYGSFESWLAHRAECLPLIERYSPAALLRACTASRAPTFLYSCGALPPPGQLPADPTHAAMFCVKFEEICNAKGVACRRGTFDELIKELAK